MKKNRGLTFYLVWSIVITIHDIILSMKHGIDAFTLVGDSLYLFFTIIVVFYLVRVVDK